MTGNPNLGHPTQACNEVPAGANSFVEDAAMRGTCSGTVRTKNRTFKFKQ